MHHPLLVSVAHASSTAGECIMLLVSAGECHPLLVNHASSTAGECSSCIPLLVSVAHASSTAGECSSCIIYCW